MLDENIEIFRNVKNVLGKNKVQNVSIHESYKTSPFWKISYKKTRSSHRNKNKGFCCRPDHSILDSSGGGTI